MIGDEGEPTALQGPSATAARLLEPEAERLGEYVKHRRLPRSSMRHARALLQRAWMWTQDAEAVPSEGILIAQQIDSLLETGANKNDLGLSVRKRLAALWPIQLRCYDAVPAGRAVALAEAFYDVRARRVEWLWEHLENANQARGTTTSRRAAAVGNIEFTVVEKGGSK